MFSKAKIWLSLALALGETAYAADAKMVQANAEASSLTPTQSIMQSIFEPISTVLSYSFDRNSFSAPENRLKIKQELAKLASHAHELEEHGKTQDRSFEFVTKSLERDTRYLERLYSKNQFDEARFTLHNMTDHCLMCHANLPETRKFPQADLFFAKVNTAKLHPLDLAQMQLMSRRFDEAMQSYEVFFRSKDLNPASLALLGSFSDYLKVSISVKSDFKRPQPMISELMDRPQMPVHVRQQLQRWLAVLKDFEAKNILQHADLKAARSILEKGRQLMEFQRDRDGLIHYLTAEAILTRYVHRASGQTPSLAEAYYLLGIASSMTEHSVWITRSDFYLESAIRLAPGASFTPKAYALLEDSMIVNFSGSSGTHVPSDVTQLLGELKHLIAKGQTKN